MNKDTQFKKKVIKPAVKEVQKYHKKHGTLPDESVIRDLKIQIINPFIRILLATFGLFLLFVGFFSLIGQEFVLGGISTTIGLALFLFALIGRKKKLEGVVEKPERSGDFALIIEAMSLIDW